MAGTRKRDLSLFVAVAISAAVHLAILLGPAWRLPADNASVLPPLDARLTPLPRPAVVQADPEVNRAYLGSGDVGDLRRKLQAGATSAQGAA